MEDTLTFICFGPEITLNLFEHSESVIASAVAVVDIKLTAVT